MVDCLWTKLFTRRQSRRQRGGILRGRKPEPVLKIFFTDMFTPYGRTSQRYTLYHVHAGTRYKP